MATATAIVLADAQATPVNHTFTPIGADGNDVYWFIDQSQANAIGYWKVSIEITRPKLAQPGESSKNRVERVRVGLHEPVLETVSNSTVSGIAPAPTIAYIPRSFTEYILPERGVMLDRKNLRKMTANLQNDANVIAVVETGAYLS